MLTIKCSFDEEFGPGGMDPLGKLVISDGASEIVIDTTYLDSWLSGLIDGLQKLSTTNYVDVKTEEPKPLEIEKAADGHLVISYRGNEIVTGKVKDLELALRTAAGQFLSILNHVPDASQNRLIDPIRRFCATTPN